MTPEPDIQVQSPGKRPQFTLRSLFLVTTVLAVVFSVMGYIGPVASAALLLAAAVVGLHVAGNTIGTTLRDAAPMRSPESGAPADFAGRSVAIPRSRSRLCERTPLRWPIRTMSLAMGAAGGLIGASLLREWIGTSISALAVVTASFIVLGVLFGFLLGSFMEILLRAWSQATSEMSKDARPMAPAVRR
jgi:hypothetical protein